MILQLFLCKINMIFIKERDGFKMYDISQLDIKSIIIYLRKSRSDSPDMTVEEVLAKHEEQLQEYAVQEFGQRIPDNQIFREVVSGETIVDRPVMKSILELLETRTIKAVLVIEPQRLSRGDLEDCGRIVNIFRYTNTLPITPQKVYDLNEEYDRKFFEMELTKGNDYLEYTKKILNRGRIASAKRGNYIASVAPYGYKRVVVGEGKEACHTLEIVPSEADAIRTMYNLFVNEGYGFKRIADALDDLGFKPKKNDYWSPASIKDLIENPIYIGKIRWNANIEKKVIVEGQIKKVRQRVTDISQWILVDGKHEAIVDEAIYYAALDKRGKNTRLRKGNTLYNPFAGLLFCQCGYAMSMKKYVNKRTSTKSEFICMICNCQTRCKTKSVMYGPFLEKVKKALKEAIEDFEIKLQNDDGNIAKLQVNIIKGLEDELKRLKEKDLRQKDAYDDGIYSKSEYLQRNAKTQEAIEKTIESICHAKNTLPPSVDYEEKIMKFTDCLEALDDPEISADKKNMLLKACIEKIVYTNKMPSQRGIGRYIENVFEIDVFLRL